ncbi:glycosyltransferase family 1 protein [Methylococcus sp. EFPC2]|uniref:glycosyltransferase family 4 protein n=1 Tax=Methylococcus sp. EFPC2 TaxID=2812648 RepID=UPI001967AD89|nr:glycosyltransferase family 1 protein [Methylococcus sp. EFPC2]QSA96853.1 glycosyltransferase family 1 protein [Methylococcus sp. EFPC2]
MKIALITDAWRPQVNGVVTTLTRNCEQLKARGHIVELFTPDRFRNWPCPGYQEIRLALGCGRKLHRMLDEFQPDAVHIATEGPLGLAARGYCRSRGFPFTTSFHTRFAEYVNVRSGIPVGWIYRLLRWFHNGAERTMTATPALIEELKGRGFKNPVLWSRGVDTALFKPLAKPDRQEPVFLYAGRVAIEKNIDAFLSLDLPGRKVVVGDGPQRAELESKYPAVRFVGYRFGQELAEEIAAADVFVFPSKTDTFGLVMLEALACGVPVAALPVQGPVDVILSDKVGRLHDDLCKAALAALDLRPEDCRAYAMNYSWENCAGQFESHLAPISRTVIRPTAWWQRHSGGRSST